MEKIIIRDIKQLLAGKVFVLLLASSATFLIQICASLWRMQDIRKNIRKLHEAAAENNTSFNYISSYVNLLCLICRAIVELASHPWAGWDVHQPVMPYFMEVFECVISELLNSTKTDKLESNFQTCFCNVKYVLFPLLSDCLSRSQIKVGRSHAVNHMSTWGIRVTILWEHHRCNCY